MDQAFEKKEYKETVYRRQEQKGRMEYWNDGMME
jgi:hypothetical protein